MIAKRGGEEDVLFYEKTLRAPLIHRIEKSQEHEKYRISMSRLVEFYRKMISL
jgi:hypothetical protein